MMAPRGTIEILIATGNPKKAGEIESVLAEGECSSGCGTVIHWLTLRDLPSPIAEPIEDQDTLAANAALKARHYSTATGHWTLADDSGLEVDALGGAPGLFSARFADHAPGATRPEREAANNRKLVQALRDVAVEKRTARFRCELALADGDRILATACGTLEGRIIDDPRGENGFGYDPHFLVTHLDMTAAELSSEHKNRISHRGRALREMKERLAALLGA
ncbi:RdgB/HAM1 family non-canonical purine NTP pyrophosphatase [Candidatus Bipolaricaulota bacterium]|nr:RdgB/HAM1 family non-canonical purine NTP pyrophosphatase [Candidatus Bipolaricaulota bacterium]